MNPYDDAPWVPGLRTIGTPPLLSDKGDREAEGVARVYAFARAWAYWRSLGRIDVRASGGRRFDVGRVSLLTRALPKPGGPRK